VCHPSPNNGINGLSLTRKAALDRHGFDAALGGAKRDDKDKERIFSFRAASHRWKPRSQRQELRKLYNGHIRKGESMPSSRQTGLSSTSGKTSRTQGIEVVPPPPREGTSGCRARRHLDFG
jgi:hypothetical protein